MIAALSLVSLLALLLWFVRGKHHPDTDTTPQTPSPQTDQDDRAEQNIRLNSTEKSCLETINSVADREFLIKTKLPLSELVTDNMLSQADAAVLQRLTIRADFTLFDKIGDRPTCVIQLQSVSCDHIDKFKRLLAIAGIILLQLPRKSSYSILEMRQTLQPFLKLPPPTPNEMVSTIAMEAMHFCKHCQSRMFLKRAKNGQHQGMLLWVCEQYPGCSGIELFIE